MPSARPTVAHLPVLPERPVTRGDCVGGPRPCIWDRCKHHLALEQSAAGDRRETCALDAADRGPLSLGEVARILGVHLTRVSQIELKGLAKIRMQAGARVLAEFRQT